MKALKWIGISLLGLFLIGVIAYLSTQQKITELTVKEGIYIEASRDSVWKVTALAFAENYKWDSGVDHSEGSGTGINGAPVGERSCSIAIEGFSQLTEKFVAYELEEFWFSYVGESEDLPFFLLEGVNTWSHTDSGAGTTVSMEADMKLEGLMGLIMGSQMEGFVRTRLQEALEELKHYIETGKPHPRKVAAIEKYQQKLAEEPSGN